MLKKILILLFLVSSTLVVASCIYDDKGINDNGNDNDFIIDESTFDLVIVENRIKERFEYNGLIISMSNHIRRLQETRLHLADDYYTEYRLASMLITANFWIRYYTNDRSFNPLNYALEICISVSTTEDYDFNISVRIISPARILVEESWAGFPYWVINVDGVNILGHHDCGAIGSNSPYIEFNYMYKPIERYERAVNFGLTFVELFQDMLSNGDILFSLFLSHCEDDRIKRNVIFFKLFTRTLNHFVVGDFYFVRSDIIPRNMWGFRWAYFGFDRSNYIYWVFTYLTVTAPSGRR